MAKRKSSTPSPQKSTTGSAGGNRARTRERREERERKRRQRQIVTISATVVAVVVIAIVLIIITSQPAEAPIPDTASATLYNGLQRSVTDEGFPRLGNPDALVTVREYSSFDCTHCAEFHESDLAGLLQRVRSGEIDFVYVPLYGTGSLPNGEGAARAAICAGEQGKFWEMHDALFSWHLTYGNQAFSGNRIASGAANMGLDQAAFDSCRNSSKTSDVLAAAVSSTNALTNFPGTPTFTVNGVVVTSASATSLLADINAAIDQALALAAPQATEVTPEVTTEPTTAATDTIAPPPTRTDTPVPSPEVTDEPTAAATNTKAPTSTKTPIPDTVTPESTASS